MSTEPTIPLEVRYLCKACASRAYAEQDSPAHKSELCDTCFVAMMDRREAEGR